MEKESELSKDGRMVLTVGEEKVEFKLQEAMRHPMDCDDLLFSRSY